MKPTKKKSQKPEHFNDDLVRKPVKKTALKGDRKPSIYNPIDDEDDTIDDFDDLFDSDLDALDDEDDDDDY